MLRFVLVVNTTRVINTLNKWNRKKLHRYSSSSNSNNNSQSEVLLIDDRVLVVVENPLILINAL